MKFGKQFSDYQLKTENFVSPGKAYVEFKKLKKVLKRCRKSKVNDENGNSEFDEREFIEILNSNLNSVMDFFSLKARKLINIHLASRGRKIIHFLMGRSISSEELLRQGKCLMSYLFMNHLAYCKIMKKYLKVNKSFSNEEMKKELNAMHQKLLHCPFLFELYALLVNLESKNQSHPENITNSTSSSSADCPNPAGPSNAPSSSSSSSSSILALSHPFSFDLHLLPSTSPDACTSPLITKKDYSLPLPHEETDFNCPICLELLYNPVSLGCGHMMCHPCACSVGNVSRHLGINLAPQYAKCPVCRQVGVFKSAVRLPEIKRLIKTKYPECWLEREKLEEEKELERVKAFWENEMASTFSFYGLRV